MINVDILRGLSTLCRHKDIASELLSNHVCMSSIVKMLQLATNDIFMIELLRLLRQLFLEPVNVPIFV